MLNWWAEFLPLFLVRLIAKRTCERVACGKTEFVTARTDVLFKK